MIEEHGSQETRREPDTRWPGVLGVVGVIVGALMFLDKLDDLFVSSLLPMQEFSRMLGPELTKLIEAAIPSLAWRLTSFLVVGTLGILLVAGSLRLLYRSPSGVTTCGLWARLAIVWAFIETVRAVISLRSLGTAVPVIAGVDWRAFAVFGVFFALLVMLAYPVFLVVWFSRPSVRADYLAWSA